MFCVLPLLSPYLFFNGSNEFRVLFLQQHKVLLLRQELIQKEILNHQNVTKNEEENEEAKLKTLVASNTKISLEKDKDKEIEKEKENEGGKEKFEVRCKEEKRNEIVQKSLELKDVEKKKDGDEKIHKTDNKEILLSEKVQVEDATGDKVDCSDSTQNKKEEVIENFKEVGKDERKLNSDLNDSFARINTDTISLELNTNCFIDGFDCDEDREVALKVS